jgi:hypothetical protein
MGNLAQKSQNQSVAKMPQKQQNIKDITKPTEAKPLTCFYLLQNQSYLLNPFYKTNSFTKNTLKSTLLPKPFVAETEK